MIYDLVTIGCGAGGCFASIRLAEKYPGAKILILEAAQKPLSKVEISGGGRCNVTHACFDPEVLVQYYPRGSKELLGPFHKFQPGDMVEWFDKKGVRLKAEEDGRMFPVTDNSLTIIDCFLKAMNKYKITLKTSSRAKDWAWSKERGAWRVVAMDGKEWMTKCLLITSGSDQRTWEKLKALGHTIISPVPSLFTFQIKHKPLTELQGISMPDVVVRIPAYNMEAQGPLLVTHWGVSGPAVLKLSAWGARELYSCGYVFDLEINWMGEKDVEEIGYLLEEHFMGKKKKQLSNVPLEKFASRLWQYLCSRAGFSNEMKVRDIGSKELQRL